MTEEKLKKMLINQENFAGMKNESLLLKKVDGKIILENLLSNGVSIENCIFNRRQSLSLLLKHKRYDLLKYVTIRNFLRKRDKKGTYLDYILNRYSHGEDINIRFYDPLSKNDSLKNIADYYITYAKHDLESYLPRLTTEELKQKETDLVLKLLTENKSLLKLMISRSHDKEMIKKKFLGESNIRDAEILDALGEVDNPKAIAKMDTEGNLALKYLDDFYDGHESIYNMLKDQDKILLDNLLRAMEGRCDKMASEAIICSYIEQLYAGNRQNAYTEIYKLIVIFSNDQTFEIRDGDESYFSPVFNKLVLKNKTTLVCNHELAHMFFHKLTDCNIDDEFFRILGNVKNDKSTIKKTESLVNTYNKYSEGIKAIAEDYYDNNFFMDMKDDREIDEFMNESKENLIKYFKHKGYKEEVLEALFKRSFTNEQYKKQYKSSQKAELRRVISKAKLGPILEIADIIDAIYSGNFLSKSLKNESNETVKPLTGHGAYYFNNKDNVFDEIFADYCAIRKCVEEDCIYYEDKTIGPITNPIKALRYIVGDELVNYLDKFYEEKVINSNKYEARRSR